MKKEIIKRVTKEICDIASSYIAGQYFPGRLVAYRGTPIMFMSAKGSKSFRILLATEMYPEGEDTPIPFPTEHLYTYIQDKISNFVKEGKPSVRIEIRRRDDRLHSVDGHLNEIPVISLLKKTIQL